MIAILSGWWLFADVLVVADVLAVEDLIAVVDLRVVHLRVVADV